MSVKDQDRDSPIEVGEGGKPLTVLQLLDEMKERNQSFEMADYPVATNNERFIHGRQILRGHLRDKQVVDESLRWPSWLSAIPRNLLRNLALTWLARVTRKEPSTKAWPDDSSPADVADAFVANEVLGYYRRRQHRRKLLSRAGWWCQAHGAVGFRVVWDPAEGPKLPTGETLGDITMEVVSIFDFGMSHWRIEESNWCFFRRALDVEHAREILQSVGITEEPPKSDTPTTAWDDRAREIVEGYEIWHLPTGRIPQGLKAIVVGGFVVDAEPFPYAHGELPLSVWTCNEKRGNPYGDTHVTDAVYLQNNLNKLHAALTDITAKLAKWAKAFVPQSMLDAFNGEDQVIGFTDKENINAVRVLTAPPPSPLLMQQIDEHERLLREIFGVNQASVGSDASQSKNARHLEYIDNLDAQKDDFTINSMNDAIVRADGQILKLAQQYVDDARTIRMVGDASEAQVVSWRGSDLAGYDVILEPAPGDDQTRAAGAREAEELAQSGLLDAAKAAELRTTGNTVTTFEQMSRRVVQMQARDALRGFAADADPSIPVEVAVAELMLIQQQVANDPIRAPLIQQLIQQYQQLAAQAQQPEQPQGQQ